MKPETNITPDEIKKLIAEALQEQKKPFMPDGKPEKKFEWKKTWLYLWAYQWLGHWQLMLLGAAAFFAYPYAIHIFYPTAGDMDPGALMKVPFALTGFFMIDFATQYALKRNWKVINNYMNPNYEGKDFGDDFANASPSTRLWISTLMRFASLLVCAILLLT